MMWNYVDTPPPTESFEGITGMVDVVELFFNTLV